MVSDLPFKNKSEFMAKSLVFFLKFKKKKSLFFNLCAILKNYIF